MEPAELRRSARLRSLSVSSDHFPFNSSDYGSTSGESVRQLFVFREISTNELQEIEREFETEFEEFKRDKLNEMSKQEVRILLFLKRISAKMSVSWKSIFQKTK